MTHSSLGSKWVSGAILLIGALFLIGCSSDDDSASRQATTVEIGALLPLSGSLSSYGETSAAALEEAVTMLGGRSKVSLMVEDTATDPPTALDKLRGLHARGVRVVIGPYASSEVRSVRDFANANGVVLLSPLSTARTLAISDDNILRFTPDDEQEGVAVAALAIANGIKTILPVSRDDEGNQGLQGAMKATFEKMGGRFLTAITYRPNETDFSDEARAIEAALSSSGGRVAGVGIYLTAFDEVTALFTAATALPGLGDVTWYGSDSVALSKGLVEDKVAAAFAAKVNYPNPILGLPDNDRSKWGPINERLTQRLGRAPDAFALAAYDALTVAVDAVAKVGFDASDQTVRREIVAMANERGGLTGPLLLNSAGDRAIGNYDFWSVCQRGTEFIWVRTWTYTAATSATSQGRAAADVTC